MVCPVVDVMIVCTLAMQVSFVMDLQQGKFTSKISEISNLEAKISRFQVQYTYDNDNFMMNFPKI